MAASQRFRGSELEVQRQRVIGTEAVVRGTEATRQRYRGSSQRYRSSESEVQRQRVKGTEAASQRYRGSESEVQRQ